jgi:hypothetical protein
MLRASISRNHGVAKMKKLVEVDFSNTLRSTSAVLKRGAFVGGFREDAAVALILRRIHSAQAVRCR